MDSNCGLQAAKWRIKLGKIGLYLVYEIKIFRVLESITHVKPKNPFSFYR